MKQNYDMMIEEKVLKVFSEMEKRVSTKDMVRIHLSSSMIHPTSLHPQIV